MLITCVVYPFPIAQKQALDSRWEVCCSVIDLSPGLPTGKELAVPALLSWLPSSLHGYTSGHV